MPFDAALLDQVENALSGCYNFHDQLDKFLLRSGVARLDLARARSNAESKAADSVHGYSRAPKRFVIQEVMTILAEQKEDGDRTIASLITSLSKGKFPDANPSASSAIEYIQRQIKLDQEEKESIRQRRDSEESERQRTEENERQAACILKQSERDNLRDRFIKLTQESNPQQRGFQLEKFLYDLFHFEGVDPNPSFRVIGEQIDGSFVWNNKLHLVEAKWVTAPIAGAEFGAFMYKLSGKTVDTRGLYISINGYSTEALAGLTTKGDLRFMCIDGSHIMRCLCSGQTLDQMLSAIWRHASEKGVAYWPVADMHS